MPKFSIRQLFAFTAIMAAGCAALLNNSEVVAYCAWSIVAVILGAAVLLAVFREADQRAYWIGFAFSGWLYVALCFALLNQGPFKWDKVITAQLTEFLYKAMDRPKSVGPADYGLFLYVAHTVWTLLVAMLGGLFASFLYSTRPVKSSK